MSTKCHIYMYTAEALEGEGRDWLVKGPAKDMKGCEQNNSSSSSSSSKKRTLPSLSSQKNPRCHIILHSPLTD